MRLHVDRVTARARVRVRARAGAREGQGGASGRSCAVQQRGTPAKPHLGSLPTRSTRLRLGGGGQYKPTKNELKGRKAM